MRVIAVDWSGAAKGSARTIWLAEVVDGRVVRLECGRSRSQVADHLIAEARRDPALVVGLDFAFSLPEWYLRARGFETARALWAWMDRHAEEILRAPEAPFWGRAGKPVSAQAEHHALRRTDRETTAISGVRPKSVFQLYGVGHVGTGSLRGMAVLQRLAEAGFTVWPFDEPRPPVVVEIYPRVLTGPVVKTSQAARAAYLEAVDELAEPERRHAVSSDDAFDAAVSAVVMWRRRTELAGLHADPAYRLEGRIWEPRQPRTDLPALPPSFRQEAGGRDARPRTRRVAGPQRWEPLSVNEAAWVAANARPPISACLCGCGGETKGRFVPGHDAVLKERLKATLVQGDDAARRSAEAALGTFGW